MKRIAIILAMGGLLVALTGFLSPRTAERFLPSFLSEAATSGPSKCQAAKLAAAGKKVAASLKCYATATSAGAQVSSACLTAAHAKFSASFSTAGQKASSSGSQCSTANDAPPVETSLDAFVSSAVATLRPSMTSSTCSAQKLKALGLRVDKALKAYASDRKKPAADKLARALSKSAAGLLSSFSKAEIGSDCLTTGDASSLNTSVETSVSGVAASLYPWPTVQATAVTFQYPNTEGSTVGEPIIEANGDTVNIGIPISVGSRPALDTFSIIVIQNPTHLTLEAWFGANLDPQAVLTSAGAYRVEDLADGRRMFTNVGPVPVEYQGEELPYAVVISPSMDAIALLSKSHDSDLYLLGYTTPESQQALLRTIATSISFAN